MLATLIDDLDALLVQQRHQILQLGEAILDVWEDLHHIIERDIALARALGDEALYGLVLL